MRLTFQENPRRTIVQARQATLTADLSGQLIDRPRDYSSTLRALISARPAMPLQPQGVISLTVCERPAPEVIMRMPGVWKSIFLRSTTRT